MNNIGEKLKNATIKPNWLTFGKPTYEIASNRLLGIISAIIEEEAKKRGINLNELIIDTLDYPEEYANGEYDFTVIELHKICEKLGLKVNITLEKYRGVT